MSVPRSVRTSFRQPVHSRSAAKIIFKFGCHLLIRGSPGSRSVPKIRTPRDLGTDLPCKGIFITRNLPPSSILLRMPCREAGGTRGSKMAQTPVSRMDQRMSFFSWLWSCCGGLNFGHTTCGSTYISSLPETSIIHPSPNSISQSISSHITHHSTPCNVYTALLPSCRIFLVILSAPVSTVLAICACNGSRRYRQRSSSKWNTRFLHSIQYSVIDSQALNGQQVGSCKCE